MWTTLLISASLLAAAPTAEPSEADIVVTTSAAKLARKGKRKALPATPRGVCQKLKQCKCAKVSSTKRCAKRIKREAAAERKVTSAVGMEGMLAGFGVDLAAEQENLWAEVVHGSCEAACAAFGRPLKGPAAKHARTTTTTTTTTRRTTVSMGGMPGFGATVIEEETSSAPGGYVEEAPAPAELVVRNLSGDWFDVHVDGKKVLEVRNDEEMRVEVSDDSHVVEIRAFPLGKLLKKARIWPVAGREVVVGVDLKKRGVSCYDSKCANLNW